MSLYWIGFEMIRMAMEHRLLEITVEYAEDLNKVNLISKMDVYVVVSISGAQKTKTPPDHDGDANPMWRFPMNFTIASCSTSSLNARGP